MNRVALVVVIVVLCLCGAVGELDARTINLRESLHLAAGDTISAQTVIDAIKAATKADTLVCNSLVVGDGINFRRSGIDTVRCHFTFNHVTFQEGAYFDGVTFQGAVHFLKATFQGTGNFERATFQGMANFWGATFQGAANFWRATFQGTASFERATLGGSDFREVMFQRWANFRETTFKQMAFFREAMFQGTADFERATFQGISHFGEATFQGGSEFRGATFQKEAYFGMVVAPKSIFIIWWQLDGHIFYSRPNYYFLLRNFQQLGYTDDYDECYYDFRIQKRKHERRWYSPIRGLEWIFLDLTCGYGVRPFRAIGWAAAVIVLFAWFYYQFGAIQERRLEAHTHAGPRGYTLLGTTDDPRTRWQRLRDALYFSANTFTTVGYGDWYPTAERLKVTLWKWTLTVPVLRFRTLAMMEGLIGWLLLALFLVTLGKKWIR